MDDRRLRVHDEADAGQISIHRGKGADDRMHDPKAMYMPGRFIQERQCWPAALGLVDGVARVHLHQARAGMRAARHLRQMHTGDVVDVGAGHHLMVRQGAVEQVASPLRQTDAGRQAPGPAGFPPCSYSLLSLSRWVEHRYSFCCGNSGENLIGADELVKP